MLKGADRNKAIIQRLDGWNKSNARLPRSIETQTRLLRLSIETQSRINVPKTLPTRDAVSSLLMQGKPALGFADLNLDWALAEELFQSAAKALVEETSNGEGKLRAIAMNAPLLKQVARDYFNNTPLSGTATEHCINAAILEACIHTALAPFLVSQSAALSDLVAQELWRRKDCPICGGTPDFAFLDKDQGARWLMCSRCEMEWLFQRLECPYCGTQKHESLGYLTNSQGLYRLYTCEECRCYIKAIDLQKTAGEVLLPLERILTVDLDRQAKEANYRSGHKNPLQTLL